MQAADHRFRDEWIIRVIQDLPGTTTDRVDQWRLERRPYAAEAVLETGLATFDDLAAGLQRRFRLGATTLEEAPDQATRSLVPEKLVRRHQVLPVRADAKALHLAMLNPLDDEAIQQVRWATNRDVFPLYAPPERLDALLRESLNPQATIFHLLDRIESKAAVELIGAPKDDLTAANENDMRAPVIQLVNAIIADAVSRRASDIHIEHDDHASTVRYRVDGLLRNAMVLPRYLGVGPVVSRIKIMAQLDVSDRLRPQDGRAKLRVGGEDIGLRVSVLPTRMGEKVVMRILSERAVQVSLEKLGFGPVLLERMRALVERPQGMFLVTGPTGSGKTTTLYSILNARKSESVNVVTVEDPIEYKLAGINQTQVNEKQDLTFASVLRSVLRQDPDVVLVGEIRDRDTASVAIQAAMTGHLVLSTLHTNDAVGAVARLRDMGIEPFKLGAALLGVSAQRLVRRTCPDCSADAPPDELGSDILAAMRALRLSPRHVRTTGCANCGFSGFIGRLTITELLVVGASFREGLADGASSDQLRALAEASGELHGMEEEGLFHLSNGTTTLEEIAPYLDFDRIRRLGTLKGEASAGATPPRAGAASRPSREAQSFLPVETADDALTDGPQPNAAERHPVTLVAMPDETMRKAVVAELRASGAVVHDAADGASAVAVAARERPHLMVVALDLPGLDGLQVLRTATTVLGLDVASVMLLGPGAHDRQQELLHQGVADIVALPASAAEIRDRAQAALLRKYGWSDTADVMLAPEPHDEPRRLAGVRGTGLLDSPREERFDKITRTAQRLFDVPIALVTLVDETRQFFKSEQGLGLSETPRAFSFCAHAIHSDDVMVVPDAALDPRFASNPLVMTDPRIRFYAGCPIHGPEGDRLGTLCIIDREPRTMSAEDQQSLRDLGEMVENEIRKQGDSPTR